MRTSELNQLIESPERLQKEQISDLQELVSEYPYFTSAQLLLTKAFFDSENLNYEKQLRLTAAYAGDRKKLHELLYSGKQMGDEVSQGEESQGEHKSEIEDRQSEVGVIDENDRTASMNQYSSSESTSDPQSPISKSEDSEGGAMPSELDEVAQAEQDFLDAQIMTAAIGNSIVDELETGTQHADMQNTDFQSEDRSEIEEEPISDLRSSISEESETSFDESQAHSFSEWLKHYSVDDKEKDDYDSLSKQPEGKQIIKTISDQAKHIQEKAEFYSAAKMARLSVTESDDLVTETLARVFEDQGKYDKAIKAYEKLRLKFPEKSIYFAGRIKAVEEKIKS